mmetsp:Transcript_18980/g.44240  ORF Transcript_18980/g.44240 Transcript_18980/m.44240 type:complete len:92 (-) Transcript_18980:11-286(-)
MTVLARYALMWSCQQFDHWRESWKLRCFRPLRARAPLCAGTSQLQHHFQQQAPQRKPRLSSENLSKSELSVLMNSYAPSMGVTEDIHSPYL